jgi:hypothetical protein
MCRGGSGVPDTQDFQPVPLQPSLSDDVAAIAPQLG